jgi:Bacterial Ig-like domain (group 3)/FG-GAP-like repeat
MPIWLKLPRLAAFALFTLLIVVAAVILWPDQRPVRAAQTAPVSTGPGYALGSTQQRMAQFATLQQRLQLRGRRKAVSSSNSTNGGAQQAAASFLGNLTTILAPGAPGVFMARQPDCSLTLSAFNYEPGANWSYTLTGITPHYEQTLHNEASLKTQADTFANGCKEQTLGIGSRIVVYAGKTTQGLDVFAGTHSNLAAQTNSVITVAVNSDYSLNSYSSDPSIVDAGSVATGDLNGDGNGDIIAINSDTQSGGSISVLLGNPNGTFQPAVTYPTAGQKALAGVVDDVNGDGKLDVVVASDTQQISVLTGKGDGTFNPAQSFPVTYPTAHGAVVPIANLITADLRGIGRKDIIASNGIVLLNNGDGTFSATPNPAFSAANSGNLAAGDVNKDGHIDLVVDENGSIISVYLGKGDGTFTAGNSYASIGNQGYVTVTDLDGDGNPDIYTGIANGGVFGGDSFDPDLAYALMGNGDGTFQGANSLPISYSGTNLGDINGDGKPDLVGINGSSFIPYLDNGNGTFTAGTPLPVPTSFVLGGHTYTNPSGGMGFSALADVTGDGKADLIFTTGAIAGFQYSDEPVYFVAKSNGDGSFATPVPAAVSLVSAGDHDYEDTLYGLQTADINGDGHTDLIFTYTSQSYNAIYAQGFAILLGNGDGTFKPPILQTTYSSTTPPAYFLGPQIAAIGDVNNDHKPDLMVIAETSDPSTQLNPNTQLELLLGNGDGTFGKPSVIPTATNPVLPINAPTPAILADLNDDGSLDLICLGNTLAGQGQMAISLGNGDGTFGTPSILNTTDGGGNIISADGLAAADFNGDGNVDIAVTSFDASASGIYFGNGDGTVTSYNSTSPINAFNLELFGPTIAADFNGDGKPDLFIANTLLINSYGTATTLATSTTSLSASATSITTGSSVTLTATVSGAGGTPTGTVTFVDGSTKLGTGTLNSSGQATYSTSSLAVGAHPITAAYGGDTNFSGSISSAVTVTVTASTLVSTTTTLTATPATVAVGGNVTFGATVAAASGSAAPTGTVTFSDGSTSLGTGTLSSGQATYSTSKLAVGTHSITAAYGGDANFATSTSSPVTVTVTAAPADFSVSLSPASGTVNQGSTTTSTITITPSGGFNSAVSFACSGLPANTSCSFSPTSVTPNGTAAATSTLTVNTNVASAAAALPGSGVLASFAMFGGLFGLAFFPRRRQGRVGTRHFLCLLALFCALIGTFAGCGGGSSSSGSSGQNTPAGTYSVTVTGTAGSDSHTAAFSLIVQ